MVGKHKRAGGGVRAQAAVWAQTEAERRDVADAIGASDASEAAHKRGNRVYDPNLYDPDRRSWTRDGGAWTLGKFDAKLAGGGGGIQGEREGRVVWDCAGVHG